MPQKLLVCALLAVWPTVCLAQDPPQPTELVVQFNVQPAAAPKPALKYQLLPELKEMNPGNPIHGYLKCFMEQQNFFFNKTAVDEREKLQIAPLADLVGKKLHDYGSGPLTRADYAARLDTPDWQILLKAKSDGVHLLLPEVQQLRMLATALKVRFRGEIADQQFDHAIVTAKTMLALSRHLGEHPTLIGNLVGIAIANVAVGPLEEMIAEPGCPNLYWALTDLPRPFIDLHKGLQGERLMPDVSLLFSSLDSAAPMTDAKLDKVVAAFDDAVKTEGGKKDTRAWLDGRAKDDNYVRIARKRLVEYGLTEAAVNEFPALQIILLDEKRDFEVRRDERSKWLSLPYWELEAGYPSATPAAGDNDALLTMLLPPIKVKLAQARVDQRIAMLRHVEALRIYAADHDGKLPAKLDDVKLPLPVDPFTGKPFLYEVSGPTALIKGTPPKGYEQVAPYNVRYSVTIKK